MLNGNDNMTLAVMGLVGGVGLFLFGMECLVRMFKDAAGLRVRLVLARMSDNHWKGLAAGTGASALLHSGPVAVILVGLVNAGILKFSSTIGMIAGANFGTTLAIQVVAFDIGRYSFGLIGAGMLVRVFSKRRIWKHVTLGLVGFGLLFLGLEVMKVSMFPFRDNPWLVGMLQNLHGESVGGILLGILIGTCLTLLLQSSGAAISILFSLAAVGMLPSLAAIIPMLLGIQIGKCAPAVLATVGGTVDSLRVTLAHVGFNIIACVVGVATIHLAGWLVPLTSSSSIRQVANYNSLIMLTTALLLVPMAGLYARGIVTLTRNSRRAMASSSHLDPALIPYPEQAISATVEELRRQGEYTREMLRLTLDSMVALDTKNFGRVERNERSVDAIRHEIERYVSLISRRRLSPRQTLMLQHLARMANALERVGDHIERLGTLTQEKIQRNLWFSNHDMQGLIDLSIRVREMLDTTLDSLNPNLKNTSEMASEILMQRAQYKQASKALREEYNHQLPEEGGEGMTPLIYMHFVTIFDKIVSHLKEVARQERAWSWEVKDRKLTKPEPVAKIHHGVPEDATIDKNFESAVRRLFPDPGTKK
ncbi:MAG: Na/Pi cotransporter family protein [Candidatus Sumerlaeia bacterium]|nr:Na/Pi cotransporter family protein [Candidatus Sumerlaeia bacterium]